MIGYELYRLLSMKKNKKPRNRKQKEKTPAKTAEKDKPDSKDGEKSSDSIKPPVDGDKKLVDATGAPTSTDALKCDEKLGKEEDDAKNGEGAEKPEEDDEDDEEKKLLDSKYRLVSFVIKCSPLYEISSLQKTEQLLSFERGISNGIDNFIVSPIQKLTVPNEIYLSFNIKSVCTCMYFANLM